MRKILWLPLLSAVCAFTSLRADVTIVQRIHSEGNAGNDITTMIKAGRMRVDYTSGALASAGCTSAIMDRKSGEMIEMMSPRRTCLKTALSDYTKQRPGMPKDAGITLKPTGKRKTISGYAADEYTGAVSGMKIDMWVTKAIPDCANMVKQMSVAFSEGPMMGLWKSMGMCAREGFPVRAVYQSASGAAATYTVVSISNKPIADSEFEVPANYQPVNNVVDLDLGAGKTKIWTLGKGCLP